MQSKSHWEQVYATKASDAVSWYQPHAVQSLRLIVDSGVARSAAILDVGGGASMLVDDLLAHGYTDVGVLDLSGAALRVAQARLGAGAAAVNWIEADVTALALPRHSIDLWHDRAVFHFLTDPADRHAYVARVLQAVRPGGHVIVSTFAEDGPLECSGLPVQRYSPDGLHAEFGAPFELLRHATEAHRTPSGELQSFIYCACRVSARPSRAARSR